MSARLRKIRQLGIRTADQDDRPATALIVDLPRLESGLLQALVPGANVCELKTASWDTLGREVYLPIWRRQIEPLVRHIEPCTMTALPVLVGALPELASSIPDEPGNLPTRQQRVIRAAYLLKLVLTLALIDSGWQLHFQPGQFYLTRDVERLDPARVIVDIQSGAITVPGWDAYCDKLAIAKCALVDSEKRRTSAPLH